MSIRKKVITLLAALVAIAFAAVLLTGCRQSERAEYNIRQDADNFSIRRRVVALNTRTDKPLFSVEGLISLNTDKDGDLNVLIKTGENQFKLFYAHLSKDVTYTSIQLESDKVNPYGYDIQFFPKNEVIEHGLVNVTTTKEVNP